GAARAPRRRRPPRATGSQASQPPAAPEEAAKQARQAGDERDRLSGEGGAARPQGQIGPQREGAASQRGSRRGDRYWRRDAGCSTADLEGERRGLAAHDAFLRWVEVRDGKRWDL